MYMQFYWVIDRVKQKHFGIFWKPIVSNLGGYFTEHHSPAHHKVIIPVYLHCPDRGQDSTRVRYSK